MNIPTIGGARGIFEIFVPGIFLLLNLGTVMYLFPFIDDETKQLVISSASNPVLVLVVVVSFGYLIGVILRLFRADQPDDWSARWLRRYAHHRQSDGKPRLYVSEGFPYIGWIEEVCKLYLSSEALEFYNKTWAPRKQLKRNKQFFNFCKIMISSNDERAAGEIYAAEALSRYIAGMFYALLLAFILILITAVLRYIVLGQVMAGFIIILVAYLLAIMTILSHFRFIRIKEVETVFAASFKNRCIFEEGVTSINIDEHVDRLDGDSGDMSCEDLS